MQMWSHPAAARVAKPAQETPATFVAFDLLASDGRDRMAIAQSERRALLEKVFAKVRSPLHLTPMTRDRALAEEWLREFAGAGPGGGIAKPAGATEQAGERATVQG